MKGQKAEDRVENALRRAGAKVKSPKASRGSADKIATWESGRKWFTQVKYSGTKRPAGLSPQERQNLISRAKRNKGTAVLAQVTPEKIKYTSVKTGRRLKP